MSKKKVSSARESEERENLFKRLDEIDSIGYVTRGTAKLAEQESSDISGDSQSFILRVKNSSNATSLVGSANDMSLAGTSFHDSMLTLEDPERCDLHGSDLDAIHAKESDEGAENVIVVSNNGDVDMAEASAANPWRDILCFAVINVFSLCCVSLQAPFFPKLAEAKGASITAAGFVFGVFQLTVFIMSLVYGSLLGKIRPRRMAITGIFVMAAGCILFGFINHIENPTIFIAVAFVLRIIQANGNASFVTASFAMIASEFPNSVAKAISYMETGAGLGLIVGPAVGGCLYSLGGFMVPFIVMGSLLLVTGVIALFFMPYVDVPTPTKTAKYEKKPGVLALLSIPSAALAGFSVFSAACAIGYILPTLEPFVHENFSLPEAFTGIVFVIDGSMYAAFAPMWGFLCDKFGCPRIISFIGSLLIFSGFCLIGPIDFMPWSPVLWGTCLGCVIFGLGLGATFVSGFIQGLLDAKLKGMPDNVETHGVVSGMWFAMMSLGCFVGSCVGGYLMDNFGFQKGIYFVLGEQTIIAMTTLLFISKYGAYSKQPSSEDATSKS